MELVFFDQFLLKLVGSAHYFIESFLSRKVVQVFEGLVHFANIAVLQNTSCRNFASGGIGPCEYI